jgi:REP element-mobilizing transposase RayT
MPRGPRPLVAGGVYHVTSRGNRGEAIFRDAADHARFLRVLSRVCERLEWTCFAWCLMGNHFHLVVRTPAPDLHIGMKRLKESHATYFNLRHGLDGHLFQGRYHSVLVRDDAQLLMAVRYVANNPATAGLCRDPADWRWSSHRALLGLEHPVAVDVAATHAHLAAAGGDGRHRYAQLLEVDLPRLPSKLGPPIVSPPTALADLLAADPSPAACAEAYFTHGYELEEIAATICLGATTVRRRVHATKTGVRPPPR